MLLLPPSMAGVFVYIHTVIIRVRAIPRAGGENRGRSRAAGGGGGGERSGRREVLDLLSRKYSHRFVFRLATSSYLDVHLFLSWYSRVEAPQVRRRRQRANGAREY